MTRIYFYNKLGKSCSHIGNLLFGLSHVHSFAQVNLGSGLYSREDHTYQVVQWKHCVIRCLHKISLHQYHQGDMTPSFDPSTSSTSDRVIDRNAPSFEKFKVVCPNTGIVKFTSTPWENFLFLFICFLRVDVKTCQKS